MMQYTAMQMLTTERAASMVMPAYIVLMASLKLNQANCILNLKFVTEEQWDETTSEADQKLF